MQITREELNPCTVKLTVVCEKDEVQTGFNKAYKAFAKKYRFPGFRPGQAPKAIVEEVVPKEEVKSVAADEIVRTVFKKALEQEDLKPHGRPSVNVTKLEEDVCEFEMKVGLAPVVELGDYASFEIEAPSTDVSDEEIEEILKSFQEDSGKRVVVTDRGAEDGDIAVVSIKTEGDAGEGRNFMIIVGQTFEGLDQALRGMRVEETKSVDLEFPKSFQEKDLAGKKARADITLQSVTAVRTPELDDEFAQQLQGDLKNLKSDTLDELKTKIRERLEFAKKRSAQEWIEQEIQKELLTRSQAEVPDTMWEDVANRRLTDVYAELREKNVSVEDYAKELGKTVEEYHQSLRDQAKAQVLRAVLIQELFNKEGMKLSNQELNDALNDVAMEHGLEPLQVFNAMKKHGGFEELHFRAIMRKVMNFLGERVSTKKAAAKS